MAEYRLYCLDGNGAFTRVHEITASGDGEAIMIARSKKLDVPCELWERGRLVAELPALAA